MKHQTKIINFWNDWYRTKCTCGWDDRAFSEQSAENKVAHHVRTS